MARPTLDKHQKFRYMMRLLNISRPLARGYLELMWDTANDSGNPVFENAEFLAAAIDFDGDACQLCSTLIEVKFLDVTIDGRYIIHDYWDHCPDYVRKRRDRELERINQSRKANVSDRSLTEKRRKTAENGGTHSHSHSHNTFPVGNVCPESKNDIRADTDKILFTFPCDGKPETWELRESKLSEWQETYKTIDVKREAMKALQWLKDNPSRRKTASGMTRYLGNWFTKAVNFPGKSDSLPQSPATADPEILAQLGKGKT